MSNFDYQLLERYYFSKVKYKYNIKSKNIKVINPYIIPKSLIKDYIDTLPLQLVKRTKKSAYIEWLAHRRIYKLGLFKKHTCDVDIEQNESIFRRVCYWIITLGGRI